MTETQDNERAPVADIATAIGDALVQAAAAAADTAGTGRSEDAEVRAIIEAMIRLLAGVPLRSDGQLTIKSLAEEAGLRRNKLTHKHTGLKDLFYALVRSQDHRPKIADQLQADNDLLRQKLAGLRAGHTQLKEQLARFARVIHVLEVENAQLREQTGRGGWRGAADRGRAAVPGFRWSRRCSVWPTITSQPLSAGRGRSWRRCWPT